jgi:hypothetical protein
MQVVSPLRGNCALQNGTTERDGSDVTKSIGLILVSGARAAGAR